MANDKQTFLVTPLSILCVNYCNVLICRKEKIGQLNQVSFGNYDTRSLTPNDATPTNNRFLFDGLQTYIQAQVLDKN